MKEALAMINDDDHQELSQIFIKLPESNVLTAEDSRNEDGGLLDNLSCSITLRHLYEIETYVINTETHQQLERVQNLMENFNKILDAKEKCTLHEDVLYWLKDYNIRVSLLLRMGLQNMDGTFVTNHTNPVAEEMLRNLGENIYQVTQNEHILENRGITTNNTTQKPEQPQINELQLFADEMLGERKFSTESDNGNCLKLSINDVNANQHMSSTERRKMNFDNIDASVADQKLEDLIADISLKSKDEESNFQDDLLGLIGKEGGDTN